jgi:cytochrome c-type biogenesis protein CcmH/NrfG
MSDSAIYAFRMATEAIPTLGDAWLNLGSTYLSVKNYGAARNALEKAVPLMPGNNTAAGLLQSIPKE